MQCWSFLNESIEKKPQFAWRCLYTPGMGEWMAGGKEGEPWFTDSSVRPAFHNNQNKQPLTEVRNAELLQPPRLCFADFLLSFCLCKHRPCPLSWLCSLQAISLFPSASLSSLLPVRLAALLCPWSTPRPPLCLCCPSAQLVSFDHVPCPSPKPGQ